MPHDLAAALVLIASTVITVGPSRLEPDSPSQVREGVQFDTFVRGPLLIDIRSALSPIADVIWWIPAASSGRVERILVLPGTWVNAGTVLLHDLDRGGAMFCMVTHDERGALNADRTVYQSYGRIVDDSKEQA
jgi:hypothetical protein